MLQGTDKTVRHETQKTKMIHKKAPPWNGK